MMGAVMASKIGDKAKSRRSWGTSLKSKSNNSSQLSCNENFISSNERIELNQEETNDLANMQLLIL